MAEQESGPYFYLSKVESREEARLWDDIFTWTENILATFQMDSILYELRRHCIGLNCGIWDYSASIISLFGKKKKSLIRITWI